MTVTVPAPESRLLRLPVDPENLSTTNTQLEELALDGWEVINVIRLDHVEVVIVHVKRNDPVRELTR